ncbi:MAG: hypothetical protein ACOH2R_08470 [Pseudomonas sp.]
MTIEILSSTYIGIIAAWATWCVVSRKVNDGVLGKIVYAVIALAGYAMVTRTESVFFTPTVAGVTFHGGLAMAGVRHYVMVNHWPRIKILMCRYLHCESCLNEPANAELRESKK